MFRAENAPDLGFIWAKNAQNLYRIMPIFKGKKKGIPKNRVSHFFRTYFRNVFEKKQKRNYIWLDNPLEWKTAIRFLRALDNAWDAAGECPALHPLFTQQKHFLLPVT